MSTQAVGATAGSLPPDAETAVARVAQLQQMLEQVASGFAASPSAASSTTSSGGFSSVLASAASAATTPTSSDTATGAADAASYAPIIDAAAAQYGINPAVLTGLIEQESGFDPNAVSSAGAEGLTQVMPENFAADGITNPFDPTQSIDGGAKQFSADLEQFGGNVTDALAAYNAGSAAVEEYGGVPPYPQTQNYVKDVLAYAQQYEQQSTAPSASATTTGGTTS
jgi:soluble lytic murein transglycosylase-like protein